MVDDDRDWLREMGALLRARGDTVTLASAPLHALWLLERIPVDAVLCDYRLASGDDGPPLLATVRDRWPYVARIIVTGWDDRRTPAAHCEAAEATLFKPIDSGALDETARALGAPRRH